MAAENNKIIVNRFVDEVWRQGHIDMLSEFWTAECINHADAAAENTGLAALMAYHEGFGTFFAGFSDMNIHVVQQVADDTKVVTHMRTGLKHTGPFNGVSATGKSVTLESMRIDRIEDGKIAEHWSVGDLAGLMGQLQE